jgi:hypothetical protein
MQAEWLLFAHRGRNVRELGHVEIATQKVSKGLIIKVSISRTATLLCRSNLTIVAPRPEYKLWAMSHMAILARADRTGRRSDGERDESQNEKWQEWWVGWDSNPGPMD